MTAPRDDRYAYLDDGYYERRNDERADRGDNLASSGYRDPMDDDPLLDDAPMGGDYRWAEDLWD